MTEAAGKFDISAEHLRTLFGNVRDLYALSIKLLEDLAKKISAWTDTQTIGEVFKVLVCSPGIVHLITFIDTLFNPLHNLFHQL